jgi:diacylglycerol kinase (ATP)
MNRAKVILNPYAGRWLARSQRGVVENELQSAGIEYEITSTDGPGHGIQLARDAVEQGYSPVIAAGGDGTISEIVNGMLQASGEQGTPPLGIIPLGSANDLVINLGLPVDIAQSIQVISAGHQRKIDIGEVSFGEPPQKRYFDNNSAIGLEPTVTLIQQSMTNLRGILRYVIASVRGIMTNPSWQIHLEWDGGQYAGPMTLVTVGNCPLTGGLYMAPNANPYDGKLTFVYGFMSSRMQMLMLLPKTMKPGAGNYIEHPNIHQVHTEWLRIRLDTPTPLHADGEIQTKEATQVSYTIYPARLPVLLPG